MLFLYLVSQFVTFYKAQHLRLIMTHKVRQKAATRTVSGRRTRVTCAQGH